MRVFGLPIRAGLDHTGRYVEMKTESSIEVWYALLLPDHSVELVEKIGEFDSRDDAREFISRHALHANSVDSLEMVREGRLINN